MAMSIAVIPASASRYRAGRHPILGLSMIFPAVLGLAVFQFTPLIVAFVNSFQRFSPFDQSVKGWAGFDNYLATFADPIFSAALINTILYIVLELVLTIPLALALAILIDKRLPGTAWARSAIIGALAASEAVTAIIWNQMYEPSTGLFNAVLQAIGLAKQPFLTGTGQALPGIVLLSVWKDVGLPMLIFLAGLQSIPSELHEAAAIDGAGPWRTFTRITLPQLRPSLVLSLFMVTITATRIFTPIMIMTQGGPEWATTNLTHYAYLQNFEFTSPGTAAATVVCLLMLLVVVTAIQARILRSAREA
jgi:ABC-type sugar transport system permease subunit